jgi:hypothetical protein
MKEAIEKILKDFADKHKQINFESESARELLAEYITIKILQHNSGTKEDNNYTNESDTCCGGNCGCDTVNKYYST